MHRRKRYDDFIQTVPLLQHLDAHERGLVADAFKEKDLEDGEAVEPVLENGVKEDDDRRCICLPKPPLSFSWVKEGSYDRN